MTTKLYYDTYSQRKPRKTLDITCKPKGKVKEWVL